MVIIWGDTRSHIAEKCHTDIYIFPIMALDFVFSPQIKVTLTCIRKRKTIRILWNYCLQAKFENCSLSTLTFFSFKEFGFKFSA